VSTTCSPQRRKPTIATERGWGKIGPISDERMRAWVQNWIELGPKLEAIKRRKLEAMTDQEAREATADLLAFPLPADLPPRLISGLVEQQYWFSRFRSKS